MGYPNTGRRLTMNCLPNRGNFKTGGLSSGWPSTPHSSIPKCASWRRPTREARSHLAADRRAFVDRILAGLRQLGGTGCTIVDEVPQWFLEGHRKPPTVIAPAVLLGPRTPASGHHTAGRRTYPQILSTL